MISNLYSDRNKARNVDEVIIFDELPRKLRVQFKFIMDKVLTGVDKKVAQCNVLIASELYI